MTDMLSPGVYPTKGAIIPHEYFLAFLEIFDAVGRSKEHARSVAQCVEMCATTDQLDLLVSLVKLVEARKSIAPTATAAPSKWNERERQIIATWKGARGQKMPDCVAEYIRDMFRKGKNQTQVRARFNVSYDTSRELREEVDAENVARVEAKLASNPPAPQSVRKAYTLEPPALDAQPGAPMPEYLARPKV